MPEPAIALTPTDLNQISQKEIAKFWGRELTDLAPRQKMLIIQLWQKIQQRRQNHPEPLASGHQLPEAITSRLNSAG